MKIKKFTTMCALLACILMISVTACGKQAQEAEKEAQTGTTQDDTAQDQPEQDDSAQDESVPDETTDPETPATEDEKADEVAPEPEQPEVAEPEPAQPSKPVEPAKPAEPVKPVEPTKPVHEHSWVPVTVHHDETGHYDIQYGERKVVKCGCGGKFYDNESWQAHDYVSKDCGGGSVETEKYEIGETWVVDSAAWDEVVGYKCDCGATK